MANQILSKEMTLTIDGSILGCTTDFSQSISRNVIEIGHINTTAIENVADTYSWNVSFSALRMETEKTGTDMSYDALARKILSASPDVSVYILPDASGNNYQIGNGILTSLEYSGAMNSLVSFSGEITGNGVLSEATAAS